MNDFDKTLINAHSYKSYRSHFKPLYYLVQGIFKPLLLCVSVWLSTQFLGNFFGASDMAFLGALVIASVIAVFIHFGTDTLIGYQQSQGHVDALLIVVVVACYALNIYWDYNSAFYVGEQLTGAKPADTNTEQYNNLYTPQISAINSEIEAIEAKEFYWCATHKKAHKCKVAQFYIDPVKDIDAVAKIDDLKAQRNALNDELTKALSNANTQHSKAIEEYNYRLGNNRKYTRYTSLVCSLLFFLLSVWTKQYGLKGVTEITSKTHYVPINNAKHKTKRKKNDKRKTHYVESRTMLTDDELREELSTMREAEKRANEGK